MVKGKDSELSRWLSGAGGRKPEPADARPVVLIIDDDETVLDALTFVLRDAYRVRVCSRAAAWADHMDSSVDVVVLDVKMAGKDGFTVYGEIREKFEDVPIIFNSAYQDVKDPREILNTFRPFGYVVKGDGGQRLLRMVARAVEARRGQEPSSSARAAEPLDNAPPSSRPKLPLSRQSPAPGRPLVLVVDDDEGTLSALEMALRGQYAVRLCTSADECVRALDEAQASAVVLDVRLGARDGFAACDEVRKIDPLVPIIFYTAYESALNPYDVMNDYRPFGLLAKNGDGKRVLEMIAKAVAHYQRVSSNRATLDRLRSVQKEMQAVVASMSKPEK